MTTITWTNTRGSEIAITIDLETSRSCSDDWETWTVPCCRITERVTCDGRVVGSVITRIPQQEVSGVCVTGRCGNVAIPTERMDEIDQARADIRTMPEYVAHEEMLERTRAAQAAHDVRTDRLDRIMGKGWTY